MTSLWVLGVGPWLLGSADFGIVVEAGTPDALCPAIELTREAVRSRVGKIEVAGGGRWHALYTIVHSPGTDRGDHIRLELRDPTGALRLERDMPVAGETCSTLAQILALVIERYFRDLATASPVEATPTPVPALAARPQDEPRPAPKPVSPSEPVVARAKDDIVQQRDVVLGVSSGLSSVSESAGLGIQARARMARSLWLRASLWGSFGADEEQRGAGALQLMEYPLRLALTTGLERDWLDLELGPEILLALEHGSAERLDRSTSGSRLVPGLGIHASATYWVSTRFAVELALSVDAVGSGLTRAFSVDGDEVLEPTPVRGLLRFGIDFAVPTW